MSTDLEVDPKTAQIFHFAAVGQGEASAIRAKHRDLNSAFDLLEAALGPADHLIGHNILHHDLPHLVTARPRLARLTQGAIDTLWLNP